MDFEICPCCGKPKRPKGVSHPSPTCAARRLDEQSGNLNNSRMGARHTGKHDNLSYGFGEYDRGTGYGDSGGASRFFFRVEEQLDDADPVRYVAKASRAERDAGLDGMPRKFAPTMNDGIGAREHNPEAPGALVRNVHPTVKPIALTRYLATLLLPPAEYAPRRIFVPFGGVMSEAIGCALAGWEEIVAVELMQEYVDVGRARADFWQTKIRETGSSDPAAILKACGKKSRAKPDSQVDLLSYSFSEIGEAE